MTNILKQSDLKVHSVHINVTSKPLSFTLDNRFDNIYCQLKLNIPELYSKDLVAFLTHYREPIEKSLLELMIQRNHISDQLDLEASCHMVRKDPGTNQDEDKHFHITSKNKVYTSD